jgi:amidophosphoribosyltransferase
MCGIFGISGHHEAAALTHLGLYSLQHRGQESAGIVSVQDGRVNAIRAMGLVSDQFSAERMKTLTGPVAMGHTRYSTAGSSSIENAQPALVHFKGGHIALAHNGNLTNALDLRGRLEDDGSIFSSSADSEVIVHRLAKSKAERPEEKLAEALDGVEGAYSLLVVIGDTLVAARDPRGWRPLVMGRLNGAYVFASETCALDIVGATVEREVNPGEIIAIAPNGSLRSFERGAASKLQRCVFEYVYFARPDSRVFGGRWIALVAPSGDSLPRSIQRLGQISYSPCRILPTPQHWGSQKSAGCPWNLRSFATTTWAVRLFSPRSRAATPR